MAQTKEAQEAPEGGDSTFNITSPSSSPGGADSYKHEGTPDTHLTAFSPEENSTRSNKIFKALSASNISDTRPHFGVSVTGSYRSGSLHAEKDPFVSTDVAVKSTQKLCPTASSFTPLKIPPGSTDSLTTPRPALFSVAPNFMPNVARYQTVKLSQQLGLSRCVVIECRDQAVTAKQVVDYLSDYMSPQWLSACHGKCHMHDIRNKVFIRFSHIKDAIQICDKLMKRDISGQQGQSGWDIHYVAPTQFSQKVSGGSHLDSDYEGQVVVTVLPRQPHVGLHMHDIELKLAMCFAVDDIFAFQPQADHGKQSKRIIIEFCDTEVSEHAIAKLNGHMFENFQVILNLYKPDLESLQAVSVDVHSNFRTLDGQLAPETYSLLGNLSLGPRSIPVNNGYFVPVRAASSLNAYNGYPMPHQPVPYHPMFMQQRGHLPTGTVPYVLEEFRGLEPPPFLGHANMPGADQVVPHSPAGPLVVHQEYSLPRRAHLEGRRQHASRVHRSGYYNAAGHHNHVDVSRIRDGIDVRTTIMLRNIPNKVDQAMLKRIVDESSWGKYDFMYLRIDFANDCNVGYAFINFVDPLDIIDFVNARGNQRWNCFKSDKVAEISYATIQGKDCLVQKFRNSSVMLEAPHYRPKLYHTTNGPMSELAGEEEPFPEPDNHSKMKRSCENAEHVGLFTPNAGQHFRDEQRRRRSQYDRGTRLAALEECDYDYHPQTHGSQ